MKILVVSNMYPSNKDKVYGSFVKSFVDGISSLSDGTLNLDFALIHGRSYHFYEKVYKYFIFYSLLLFKLLTKKYDVIYVHQITHATPILLLSNFIRKQKIIFNIHGEDLLTATWISGMLLKTTIPLLERAEKIVVPSLFFKDVLLSFKWNISNDKIIISESGGVDNSVFKFSEFNGPRFKIAYVSRIDRGKGWDIVLEALRKIAPNLECHFIGSGF
jgi:glycosyltransferase involved in cell wall biosynthesis